MSPTADDKARVLLSLAGAVNAGGMTISEALQRAFELGAIAGKIEGVDHALTSFKTFTERAQTRWPSANTTRWCAI